MKIELDLHDQSVNRINSYEKGRIIINGEPYSSSLIVTPTKLISHWGPERCADFAPQHFVQITALNPEIILLGTGQHFIYPAQELLAPIYKLNIGLEIMDTGAVCRCFNLLASEGREVAAALLPIT